MEQLFHGDKANDLKVLYGIMFEDVLKPYTHWGWMDTDVFFGDMSPMLQDLEHYDVVTYPNGVGLLDIKNVIMNQCSIINVSKNL